MGYEQRANEERRESGNGKDTSDQHTLSAKQMVQVMLGCEKAISSAKKTAQMALRPVDMTPTVLDVLSAQSRALAFILDELLLARGEKRAIVFSDGASSPPGPRLIS